MKRFRTTIIVIIFCVVFFGIYYFKNNKVNTEIDTAVSESTRIHFVDVGQGDCTIIESNGEYMLIDAGDYDKAEKVSKYIKDLNIDSFKFVIATHPHADHIGSMETIINNYTIDNFIMPNVEATSYSFEGMLKAVESHRLNVIEPVIGNNYSFGDCSFTIISPYKYDSDNMNNNSVGIKLTHGSDSFLFMGDTEKTVEQKIVDMGRDISCTLYKANHHGSSTSSSEDFLMAMMPEYVVISCGKNNNYGHPHPEILSRYKQLGMKIYRTDESGDIIVTSTGNGLKFNKGVLSGTSIG